MNFTNVDYDNRAIWASWYQVFESSAKVKNPFQSNPISELAIKLKIFSPSQRKKWDNQTSLNGYEFEIAGNKIIIN